MAPRVYKKRSSGARPKRKMGARRRAYNIPRSVTRYNKVPSFVETMALGRYTANAGNLGSFTFATLPQAAQYKALYKQYRINRLTYTLIPDFNSYNPDPTTANAPRLCYEISDTVGDLAPASEAEVLAANGCKIVMFTKPVKMTCKPVAYLTQGYAGNGAIPPMPAATVGVDRKMQWLNTSADVVPHGAIKWWVTAGTMPGPTQVSYSVYLKISFSLKDPQ